MPDFCLTVPFADTYFFAGVAERAIGLLEQHASATSAGGPFALTARLVHGVRMVVARAFPSRLSDMTDAYAQLQLAYAPTWPPSFADPP